MRHDRSFTHLLAELRQRAAIDVDPEAYWRGVIDALAAMGEVPAGEEQTARAGLRTVRDPTAPRLTSDPVTTSDRQSATGRAAAQLEQTASWLAGFALAATRGGPADAATVVKAAQLTGVPAVVHRARQLLEVIANLDEGHRERALDLIERCRDSSLRA